MALDALEQALHARRIGNGLIHESDRRMLYPSIRYSETLKAACEEESAGTTDDAYDNAIVDTNIDLFKT